MCWRCFFFKPSLIPDVGFSNSNNKLILAQFKYNIRNIIFFTFIIQLINTISQYNKIFKYIELIGSLSSLCYWWSHQRIRWNSLFTQVILAHSPTCLTWFVEFCFFHHSCDTITLVILCQSRDHSHFSAHNLQPPYNPFEWPRMDAIGVTLIQYLALVKVHHSTWL